ncbi:MAG: hypothetical protein IJC49_03255 [Clostridia bacterium]|nr:hypothetical protein [Clostridia bacterium]
MNLLGIASGEHLLWCFAAGLMIACVYGFYAKCVIGKLIRGLAREDACDEHSAVTLNSLGCGGPLFGFALRKGTALSESVIATEDGERYYLLPEAKEKMLAKYGANSSTLISLVVTLLAAVIAAILCAALLPWATDLFKGLIG